MAPYLGNDVDNSGYTPDFVAIQELRRQLLKECNLALSYTTKSSMPIVNKVAHPILELSLEDVAEIEDAVQYFETLDITLCQLQAEHFPLPTLARRIRKFALGLASKQPYFLIRGLQPQWFDKRKNVVIFMGISSHVGTKRAMAAGEPDVLHHITNMPIPDSDSPVYRGPANRTMPIPFHNDAGQILAFYTLSKPMQGGSVYLADIEDIEAQIRASRPELLDVLRKDWILANPGIPRGYDKRPLMFTHPKTGRTAVAASRARVFGTPSIKRPESLPPLSKIQVEAFDALHVAGQRAARHFPNTEGDMLFFNNLRMMHARDSFIDGDEEEGTTKRYLLRLILKDDRNPKWETPRQLESTWKEIYDHEDEDEVVAVHEKMFSYKTSH